MSIIVLSIWLVFPQSTAFPRAVSLDGTIMLPSYLPEGGPLLIDLETVSGVPIDQTHADSDGNFAFRGLAPGNYFIRVNHPGFFDVREFVRLPLVGRVIIGLRSLFGKPRKDPRPADGAYTVDLSELKLPEKARSEYDKGINDHKDSDSKHAIEHLENAIRIAPEFYRAHLWLAREYQKVGRVSDAEKHFLRAAELNRREAAPLSALGGIQLNAGKFNAAQDTFEAAAARDPQSAAAAYGSGIALYKLDRLDEAESALLRAQEMSPENPAVRLMLVNVYLKQGDWQRAMTQIDGYLDENPEGEKKDEVLRIRRQILATHPSAG